MESRTPSKYMARGCEVDGDIPDCPDDGVLHSAHI